MQRMSTTCAATLLVFALLTGSNNAAHAEPSAGRWDGEMPVRQPWLRDHLPDGVIAYLRVPQLFGLLATPKGSVLDPALGSAANARNVLAIRKGIVENVLPHIPAFADLRLRMLEQYQRSPLEVAAFFTPSPSVLVALNLDLDTHAGFEDMVAAIALESPDFALLEPLDNDGVGRLAGEGVSVFLQFDADSGRLLVNAGPGVTAQSFDQLRGRMQRREPHAMRALESRIDASGQGFFTWIDAGQAVPAMQMFVPPEQFATVSELGLDRFTALGLGWGVSNGKGRLSLLADLPASGDRGFFPVVRNDLSLRTVGEPDALIVMSVPGADEFLRLESLALLAADEDTHNEWQSAKELFREYAGIAVEELLAAIGPDLVVVFDEAGDYAALRLRDRRVWERMVQHLAERAGSKPAQREIDGQRYYHLSLPNELGMLDDQSVEDMGWFAVLLQRQRDHLYWSRDEDYLYIASIPQILVDRDSLRARDGIADWLADTQRIDASNALMSVTTTTSKLPQRLYATYIEAMQMLADIAETEVDIWSMPTAAQLDLPEQGALGMTLHLGDPTIGVEFTFENNPAEFVGGLGGVAAIGVIAAIAIPAYQDYTVRATVSQGLAQAAAVQDAVATHYADAGAFPDAEVAATMSQFPGGPKVRAITVEAGSGRVIIEFVADAVPADGQVVLEPEVSADGGFHWTCSSSIADKQLPASCRAGDQLADEV